MTVFASLYPEEVSVAFEPIFFEILGASNPSMGFLQQCRQGKHHLVDFLKAVCKFFPMISKSSKSVWLKYANDASCRLNLAAVSVAFISVG